MNTVDGPELHVDENLQDTAHACSQYILSLLAEALRSRGTATIAISGGSTPRPLFSEMAKARFDWSKTHVFWVDERCVPPDNKESNFKLANETLLGPAKIAPGNIHRILGELPPPEAAQHYVADIKTFFELDAGALPVFDVLHRGMGPDAHTASLFPGSHLIEDRTGIATNVWVEKMKMDRVTLLPGVLFAAKHTVLLVSGADKAEVLRNVLEGPEDFLKYPCQIASRNNRAVWFLDKGAASKL